jgi:hypothetical protein
MINDKEKGAITQGTGRRLEEARPGGFNCKARIVDQRQAHVEAEVIYPCLCQTFFGPISKVLRHETRTHLSYF